MLKEHGGYINNTDSIFQRKHGWTNLKKIESDRAIAFNLRTPTWLKTYLFFLPLKTSVKYGLNPEEFRENQSFTPK